jgi:hypothetical protein
MEFSRTEKAIVESNVVEANDKAERNGLGRPFTFEVLAYDAFLDRYEVSITVSGRTGWEGWTLAGLVRWNEAAPVIARFDTYERDVILRTPESPKCDHCGTLRDRSTTFLVESPEGDLRQVGTSCLEVYTGISPRIPSLIGRLTLVEGGHLQEAWGTEYVLHAAVALTDALGYVKTSEGLNSTREVFHRITKRIPAERKHAEYGLRITWGPEQAPEAEAVRAWCLAGADENSEYRVSLAQAAAHDEIGPRALGLMLSAVASYRRDMARQEEARLLAETAAPVPTGRVEIVGEIRSQKVVHGQYGETVKITLRTDEGWLAHGTCPKALIGSEIGDRVAFTAMVTTSDRAGFGWFARPTKARRIAHVLAA